MEKKLIFDASRSYIWGRLTLLCCLFLTFFACVQDDVIVSKGLLSLQMNVDTTLTSSLSTKATSISELKGFEDADSYKVVISQDSGVVAEYARFDKMPEELELKPGKYSLEVSKGTKSTAAFNSPYFSGKQDFTIVEEMTTPVEVTASLANSRVTVEFSDDFIETYKDYTLSFKTNKMSLPLVYEKGESRPMYFESDAAGTKLTIGMELVNVYGKDVQFNATTTIKPKQWSKLTIRTDEKGLNGVAIDVVLNDETKETVYVNIGIPDFMELLKGAPFIACEAFKWDKSNVSMETPSECEKKDCTSSATVDITAGRKINQVLLTIVDDAQNTLVNQYDLVNLTSEQAAELKDKYGFVMPEEEIKGKISGIIDLKSIITSLPGKVEGDTRYELTLTVKDITPNQSTTKKVSILVPEIGESSINWGAFPENEFDYGAFSQGDQIVNIDIPAGIETATISIDGLGINEQDISSLNVNGIEIEENSIVNIKLKFTQDWFNSLSFGDGDSQTYTIKFNIVDKLETPVENNTKSFIVNRPVFEWAENAVDAFAKYAFLKIKTNYPDKVTFYGNGQQIDASNIGIVNTDVASGVVTFVCKKLTENTSYNITAKYNNDDKLVLVQKTFETESVGILPNSGFENWYYTRPEGVKYWEVYFACSNEETPIWNTLNQLTTSEGGTKTSWFDRNGCRYSANSGTIQTNDSYKGSYAALIKTVGWGGGNSAAAISGMGTCENITPGELYLGTYNAETHSASYDGYLFESRPFAVSFAYKYVPKNSEDWGFAIIEVVDANGKSLAKEEKILVAKSSYIVETVKLNYTLSGKAARIKVSFKSSGNSNCWGINEDNLTPPPARDLSTGEYVGSQLYIDNIELIYDYE